MNFQAIDAERRRQGRSVYDFSKTAGVAYSTYWFIKTGRTRPASLTLKRYLRALGVKPGGPPKMRLAGDAVGLAYRAFASEFARAKGLDPDDALACDPSLRAVNNPAWLAAARVRELAIYAVVTEFAVPMAALGRAIGLTKQAVSKAARRVEEAREDDPWLGENEFSRVITQVAARLKGREGV